MESDAPKSEIILYQAENGQTRIHCQFESESAWLAQSLIAEWFARDVRTISEHLVNIFDRGELSREAAIRKFWIVRLKGNRQVACEIEHHSFKAILAISYRVRNHRCTQFCQWATVRLTGFMVKGFVMGDEPLKNLPSKGRKDYSEKLLERVRDIRSSGRRFHQKILDISATNIDYSPNTALSEKFLATIQNKIYWASCVRNGDRRLGLDDARGISINKQLPLPAANP